MRDVAQGTNAPLIGVKGFHVTPKVLESPLKEAKKTSSPIKLTDALSKSPMQYQVIVGAV
jgi:hypothetical protein